MTKIVQEDCRRCEGHGRVPGAVAVGLAAIGGGCCPDCGGTGVRYVPEGYSQDQIDVVRSLVDAMAVARGV